MKKIKLINLAVTSLAFLVFFVEGATTDWTRIWGSVSDDYGKDVGVDSSGNIYVTGYAYGPFDGQNHNLVDDLFLTKFDKNGNRIWSRIRNNGGGHDKGLAVAVDSSNNIFVAGHNAEINAWLLKFDNDGTDLWERVWGDASKAEVATSMAIDNFGNVFAAGYTYGEFDGQTNAGDADIFLTKFDNAGTKLWSKICGSVLEDRPHDVCIDSSNNVYIAGHTFGDFGGQTNSGDKDFCLLKFDNYGSNLWTRIFGSNSEDIANGVALDSSGNVYIGGFSQGDFDNQTNAGNGDLCLLKFDDNGNKQWTRMWGSVPWDVGMDVTIDKNDNIYIAGYTKGEFDGQTNNGDWDLCMSKFNSSGDKYESKIWGSGSTDMGYGISSDNQGNMFVTGNTGGEFGDQTNSGEDDICLTKFKTIPEPFLIVNFYLLFIIFYWKKL